VRKGRPASEVGGLGREREGMEPNCKEEVIQLGLDEKN